MLPTPSEVADASLYSVRKSTMPAPLPVPVPVPLFNTGMWARCGAGSGSEHGPSSNAQRGSGEHRQPPAEGGFFRRDAGGPPTGEFCRWCTACGWWWVVVGGAVIARWCSSRAMQPMTMRTSHQLPRVTTMQRRKPEHHERGGLARPPLAPGPARSSRQHQRHPHPLSRLARAREPGARRCSAGQRTQSPCPSQPSRSVCRMGLPRPRRPCKWRGATPCR